MVGGATEGALGSPSVRSNSRLITELASWCGVAGADPLILPLAASSEGPCAAAQRPSRLLLAVVGRGGV